MEKKYLNFSNKKSLQLEREKHLAEFAVSLTEKQKLSLYKKSQKSGIDTGILEEVYRRGYLIWKPDLFEGTREQFAFDRVNSFISGGFAADIDKDLLEAETLEESDSALRKKAAKSGVSFGTLKKVYNRGMAAWKTGHRPGTTPQQWGMARVNSYITKGKTYHTADKDLREEYPAVRKDKETGLPKKYTTGKTGTDKARAAHFARGRKMADDDPRAYEPAPGDKTAKTKESEYTKKAREMYGENINYELPTTNPDLSSSRFDGTDELVNIYKSMTPGQEPKPKAKIIIVIRKAVKEKRKKIEESYISILSEGLRYMKQRRIPLSENVYRYGSEKFFETIQEARELYNNGLLELSESDIEFINTDIGEFGEYDGETVPLDLPLYEEEKNPPLNKPKRGGPKKFYVYVKDPSTGNIKKVTWGDTTGLSVKLNDPAARKSFAARHKCSQQKDRTSAAYWACNTPRYAKALGLSGGGNFYW
jgi:hypothetical protein